MTKNNRIAFFLIDYSITGGVEKVTANLSYLFNDYGIKNIHLISLNSKNTKPEISYHPKLKIHVLKSNTKKFTNELSTYLTTNKISNLIFQGDNMSISLNALDACKLSNCNPILHYHGSPYAYLKKYIFIDDLRVKPLLIFKLLWSKIQYPFKKQKLKKVITKTSGKFVCVSKGSENELKNLFNLIKKDGQKIITIHNPIVIKEKANTDYIQKEKLISYVARLTSKHKNAMLVAKVWGKIAKKHPSWTLQIIGDGVLKKEMQNHLNKSNTTNVTFTGMVSNVSSYLKKSSIAINTSNCEGFGLAIAEAGYYKNALISTNSDGGITDIIQHNKTGVITSKNNVVEMANSISEVINNEQLRSKYAQNAQNRVLEIIDKDIVAEWISILKNE